MIDGELMGRMPRKIFLDPANLQYLDNLRSAGHKVRGSSRAESKVVWRPEARCTSG